jgi:ribose transport system permease protein
MRTSHVEPIAGAQEDAAGECNARPAEPADRKRTGTTARVIDRYGVLFAWLAVIGLFGALRPHTFLTIGNFQTIFSTQATLLILSLALLVPLTVGEFDLSVAGTLGVSYVLMGDLTVNAHLGAGVAIIAALAAGLAVGLINAFVIVVIGVESIIVTLGMGTALDGVAHAITSGPVVGISNGFVSLVNTKVLGLPMPFYVGLLLTIGIWYLLRFTPIGRYMLFVGINRSVVRLAGVRVDRIRVAALVAASLVAALAGVVMAGYNGASDPDTATALLLPVFAAVFLGATTITPGRFNAWGTFVAVYFLTTGIAGLELTGVTGWVEELFYGLTLVVAVALSRLLGRPALTKVT